jgi:hypothetical protein
MAYGQEVTIHLEERPLKARSGESIGAALVASGLNTFRRTAQPAEWSCAIVSTEKGESQKGGR